MLTQRILQKRWQASTALGKRKLFYRKTPGSLGIVTFDHRLQKYDVQVHCEKLSSLSALMLMRQT